MYTENSVYLWVQASPGRLGTYDEGGLPTDEGVLTA